MSTDRFKFRCWDLEHQIMKGQGEDFEVTCFGVAHRMQHSPESLGKLIWMQCTGLKDRNGKEIYEGDVVQWTFPNHYNPREMLSCKVVVNFRKGGFAPFTDPSYSVKSEDVEILGNLYENPELLKSEV